MKKSILIGILAISSLFMYSLMSIKAQQDTDMSVSQRIKLVENNLTANKKLFKILGENKVGPDGKIIQKISTNDSFEILALPMIEPSESSKYTEEFVGKLYSQNGMLLSEIKSNMGIKVAAQLNEREEKKEHKFEFYNPNAQSVKVRFYFVQDESQLEK